MKEIFERRSVRTYTDRDITPDEEERLLRAGMQAPSAGNERPWHFIVIRSREAALDAARTAHRRGIVLTCDALADLAAARTK